jgi:hypothetical protein
MKIPFNELWIHGSDLSRPQWEKLDPELSGQYRKLTDDEVAYLEALLPLREAFEQAQRRIGELERLLRRIGELELLLPKDDAEELARLFHETYERLAPDFGYKTREASAVPWENVPDQNKALMVAVCAEILSGV